MIGNRELAFIISSRQCRYFHSSVTQFGQKAKRRKQKMREAMPHLPLKNTTALPTMQALSHFDQFYSSVYKTKWNSIRLGLMSKQKHAVIVNNFGNSEETCEKLTSLGCIDIQEEFKKGFRKVEPYIPLDGDNHGVDDSEKVGDANSNEAEDYNEATGEELEVAEKDIEEFKSLDPTEADERLIKPDKNVLGGSSMSMYKFMPTAKLKGMEEFVEEAEYYDTYTKVEKEHIKQRPFTKLNFPPHLKCFTFQRSDLSSFPSPSANALSTFNYYCLDGGSLLPVLALDVKPGP